MAEILRVVHTLLAIAAVGTNLTFPIWIKRAEHEGSSLGFTLATVRAVDKWVTIPSYLFTAISGIALVVVDRIPFSAAWIWMSIALFVLLMGLGFGPYRPLSRRRLALARAGAPGPEYWSVGRRIDYVDGGILGAAVLIAVLMVLRPA